jgi:hypothetical protein
VPRIESGWMRSVSLFYACPREVGESFTNIVACLR